jgi:hypothetical protein
MNWYAVFYLFSLADKISAISGGLAVITALILTVILIVGLFGLDDWDSDDWKIWRKFLYIFLPFTFFFSSMYMLVPDRKDMLLIIAGGSVGQFVATDENAKQIPADVARFLRHEIVNATADLGDSDKIRESLGIPQPDTLKDMTKEQLIKIIKEK